MLKHLLIKNYALIKALEISPSANLNMITGETGAGKSIMLGAVGLLLGNRADTKSLFDHNSKCVVEGHFDLAPYGIQKLFEREDLDYEDTSIIRREISPSGKSRAFINDTPVTLDTLKRVGLRLMDVHSQHQTLDLAKRTYQISFIDAFAESTSDRHLYNHTYSQLKKAEEHLAKLRSESAESNKDADYERFLLDELVSANLNQQEQEELEEKVKVMENAEDIKHKFNAVLEALLRDELGASNGLYDSLALLRQLASYSENYQKLHDRLNSTYLELSDIISEIEKEEEAIEFDPEQTAQTQERLTLIYNLLQKHKVASVLELLEIQENLSQKVSRFQNMDTEIEKAQTKVEQIQKQALKEAQLLSKKRQVSFSPLEKQLKELLTRVGIPEASIKIERTTKELGPYGIDDINLLFSANKGISPQEISKVASGGEFSRLMFCVKFILAKKIALPTIIFDEIDSGVSGEIALKLGSMMKQMAENHQLITISHLPQVAAKGDQHYFVFKDTTEERAISKIKALSKEERIEQIAKMIGGDQPSAVAFDNARELIGIESP
ncbi:MAG: DNA repair protein RecN [Bacteroidota bacterium]